LKKKKKEKSPVDYMETFTRKGKNVSTPRKYEEYAYVIDLSSRRKSSIGSGKKGDIIVIAIGEDHLTLLKIRGVPNSTFEVGERIFIGKEGRTKVQSVMSTLEYSKISSYGRKELRKIFEKIILNKQPKIVEFFSGGKKLTQKRIDKLFTMIIINKLDSTFGVIHNLPRVDW